MSNTPRSAWWRNTPMSEPPDDDGNVVKMRSPSWTELEREIIDATNQVVHWEAEAVKVQSGYQQSVERLDHARRRFAEKCKDMGCKVEFLGHPPELDNEKP